MEEKLLIPVSGDRKLAGLIHNPGGQKRFTVVIFSSGLGMDMHEWQGSFDEIAERLNKNGIMTVQFDYPIFKGDKCREISLTQRSRFLKDVVRWVINQKSTDKERVGILAQSFGAATVIFSPPKSIKTMAFIGTALSPKKSIVRVYEERGVNVNYNGDTTLPRSSGENTTVGKEFWKDVLDFDDSKLAAAITAPLLMLHGNRDTKITVADVKKFYAALGSKQKKLKIFKDGDHGIIDVPRVMREEFLKEIVSWFRSTL